MDNKFKHLIFFAVLLFCIIACSKSPFDEKSAQETTFLKGNYRIIFSLPGDDFASAVDLQQLQIIKETISKEGVGKPIGTGSGMGNMVLIVNINTEEAMRTLKHIIHNNYPSAEYKIVPENPF